MLSMDEFVETMENRKGLARRKRFYWNSQRSEKTSSNHNETEERGIGIVKIPKKLAFGELVTHHAPMRMGVMEVMRFSGRRSAAWQTQLLVLEKNILAVFSTKLPAGLQLSGEDLVQSAELLHTVSKTKSDVLFDLSEPSLNVSVAASVGSEASSSSAGHNNANDEECFEWTLSLQRLRGLILVRFKCKTMEERDGWVSALRSFEARQPTFVVKNVKYRKSIEAKNQIMKNAGRVVRHLSRSSSSLKKKSSSSDSGGVPEQQPLHSSGSFMNRKKQRQMIVPGLGESQGVAKTSCCAHNQEQELLLQRLERRFESRDYVVHGDQAEIEERQNSVAQCFLEYLVRNKDKHDVEPTMENAQVILQLYDWNLHQAMHRLLSKEEPLALTQVKKSTVPSEEKSGNLCEICFESSVELAQLPACGHEFCVDCWSGYFETMIQDGKSCLRLKCMDSSCQAVVPSNFIKEHCQNADLIARFERYAANSFVDACKQVKWCPRPGCGCAVEWKLSENEQDNGTESQRMVKCKCGFAFCFDCGDAVHAPATCSQIVAWNKALQEAEEAGLVQAAPRVERDAALAKSWILEHSRPCPKCKSPIEKAQGCNHMVCSSCKHEFCWFCFQDWSTHGSHTGGFFRCNKFQDDENALKDIHANAKEATKSELNKLKERAKQEMLENAEQEAKYARAQALKKRVQHYLWRHDAHHSGRVWADRMLALVTNFESELGQVTLINALERALKVVSRCRDILRWSYILAYFLNDPKTSGEWFFLNDLQTQHEQENALVDAPHRALVAAKIGQLEQITERLQHAVEAPALAANLFSVSSHSTTNQKIKTKKAFNASIMASLHQKELADMTYRALESCGGLLALAKEINFYFERLATAMIPDRKLPLETILVETPQQFLTWQCTLCDWTNQNRTACLMCSAPTTENVFARYRTALFQQVRNCISCSAELQLSTRNQSPCCWGDHSLFSCSANQFLSVKHLGGFDRTRKLVGEIDLICPECDRKILEPQAIPGQKDQEANDTALFGTDEEEITATSRENADLPANVDLCPWGHAMQTLDNLVAHDCDACDCALTDAQNVRACTECNWAVCSPCAHIHGYLSRVRHRKNKKRRSHRSGRYRRRRRNAVVLNVLNELRSVPSTTSMSQQENEGWTCPRCTFWNENAGSLTCTMCLQHFETLEDEGEVDGNMEQRQQQSLPEEQAEEEDELRTEEDGDREEEEDDDDFEEAESSPQPTSFLPPPRSLLMSPTNSFASNSSEELLGQYQLKGGPHRPVMISAPLSSAPFISHCTQVEGGERRCLTLLKPIRRDSKRAAHTVLKIDANQSPTIELWWETKFGRSMAVFTHMEIIVYILCGGQPAKPCAEFTTRDTGVCNIRLPPYEHLASILPDPTSQNMYLWVELKAFAIDKPTLSVTTPIFHLEFNGCENS